MVDEVATISEETTSEAETVAAAAEEQTSALTEVSNSADELSQQATVLSEALDRFDTDADDDAGSLGIDELETEHESAGETLSFDEDDGTGVVEETESADANAGSDPLDDWS
ncbi:hypothetical protein [Halobiforma nitratireducens]|uniref:Methyl-accepting chemotaxis sensory transducer n=1 Tax=Halobiforma nitratireducens JCM 10879 TaxID=1227454 RepID=M0M9Y0_9EURY|nr:methyl-accepting chemotaxis sensory transducer [Halobiforma nitratireducens JCM 10879]